MPYQAHNSGKGKHPFLVILQVSFDRVLKKWSYGANVLCQDAITGEWVVEVTSYFKVIVLMCFSNIFECIIIKVYH